MMVYVLMQNDTPIGVYRTTKGVKSRIKAIKHHLGIEMVKRKQYLSWVAFPKTDRHIHYWVAQHLVGN